MNPERVGRDGFLSLNFEHRGGRTVLARSRFRLPLQVLAPSFSEDGTACLLLLNPGGGIVGGDRLEIEIRLGSKAHAYLTTPSATAVYRSLNESAVQQTTIRLEEDSVLEYCPEHIIPYAGSALSQSLHVEMAERSCLILSESFSAGRIARGERWKFRQLASETRICRGESLVYMSKSNIVPAAASPARLGVMGNFNYMASVLIVSDRAVSWNELANELATTLEAAPDLTAGVSLIGQSGCVIRMLALSSSEFKPVICSLWTCIRKMVLKAPPLPQRKY